MARTPPRPFPEAWLYVAQIFTSEHVPEFIVDPSGAVDPDDEHNSKKTHRLEVLALLPAYLKSSDPGGEHNVTKPHCPNRSPQYDLNPTGSLG